MQNKLKEKYLNVKKEKEHLDIKINQYLEGIRLGELEELGIDGISDLFNIIEKDKRLLKKELEEMERLEKELKEVDIKISKQEEQKKIEKEIKEAKMECEELKKILKNIECEKQKIDKNEIKRLEEKNIVLKNEFIRYDEYADLLKNIDDNKKEEDKLKLDVSALRKTILENEKNEKLWKEEVDKNKNIEIEIEKNKNELNLVKERKTKNNELKKKIEELLKENKEVVKIREAYLKNKKAYDENRKEYDEAYLKYIEEQSGIIAKDLKENMECPVCGSKEHPKKAKLSLEAPTKEELEQLKINSENAQIKTTEASEELSNINTRVNTMQQNIFEEIFKVFGEKLGIEEASVKVEEGIAVCDKLYQEKELLLKEKTEKKARKEILEKQLTDMTKKQEQFEFVLKQKEKEQINISALISNYTKNILKIKEEITFNTKREANEDYEKRKTIIEQMIKGEKDLEKSYLDKKQKYDLLIGKIESFEKQAEKGVKINTELLEVKKGGLVEAKTNINNVITNLNIKIETNSNVFRNIKSKIEEIQKVEEEYKIINELSGTANGALSGKEKVTLETYVQMTFFDKIIAKANVRLLAMTEAQYELKRKEEAGNNRAQSGLDLEVIDYYNGTRRDVKTLSGGEAFKASLSLALGLSDEIQSLAGGINLQTMFVDEGFGSLDEESLQKAIKTLTSLSENGRLIGIISHVNELKEKIDNQLIIRKDKSNGSYIENQ